MNGKEKEVLSRGLKAGFAGGSERKQVDRGGFLFETSHFEGSDSRYHDEWLADRVGGGQEVIEVDGKKYTRLYAGGTIGLDELDKLGLTKKDIIKYLITKIQELGDKTRLLEGCEQEDDEWGYEYRLLDREDAIPVSVGKETIKYKDELVFVHDFLLCPVE
jgi:hypothetical protein